MAKTKGKTPKQEPEPEPEPEPEEPVCPQKEEERELTDEEARNQFPWSCPQDPRYHNQNKTGWCFNMFLDHQKCTRLLGKGFEGCEFFQKCYTSICPNAWVERWLQQIEDGTFPVDLPEEKEKREGQGDEEDEDDGACNSPGADENGGENGNGNGKNGNGKNGKGNGNGKRNGNGNGKKK